MENMLKEIKQTLEEFKSGLATQKEMEERIAKIEERLAERNLPVYTDKEDREELARWFRAAIKGGGEHFKTAGFMAEGTDADGGYLVPPDFYPGVMRIVEEYGLIRAGSTVFPMKSDELPITTLTSGLVMSFVDEGASESGQKPQFGSANLVAKKMMGVVPVTNELLDDSGIDISNLLLQLFGEAIAEKEDTVGFTGDTGGGDAFDGILNDSGVTTRTMGSGDTDFTDVDADDLADLTPDITSGAAKGARFYLHRTVFNVVRKLKDSNGNYIYVPPGGDQPGTLWGYPYELSEVMPSISDSAVSTPLLAFGNLKHFYLGDRKKLTVAKSTHASFSEDKTLVRVTHRVALSVGIGSAFAVLQTAGS